MKLGTFRVPLVAAGILCIGISMAHAQSRTIDNSTVYLVMNHSEGDITELKLKTGSNRDIVNQYWSGSNRGLCQLWDETCTLIEERLGTNTALFVYDSNFGEKTVLLDWSDDFMATIEWHLDAPFDHWYAAFEPGGDNGDGNDWFAVCPGGSIYTNYYRYPGGWTLIWEGDTPFSAIRDLDYPEVFGYRFEQDMHVRHANGVSVDHYIDNLPAGRFRACFGLKRTNGPSWWEPIQHLPMDTKPTGTLIVVR